MRFASSSIHWAYQWEWGEGAGWGLHTVILILGLLGKGGWMHGGGCMWLKLP